MGIAVDADAGDERDRFGGRLRERVRFAAVHRDHTRIPDPTVVHLMSLVPRDPYRQARYGRRVTYPQVSGDVVGWITRDQMIDVDRSMIDEIQIGLIQMKENAGRNLARVAIDLFDPRRVTIVAGSGGNGGGGLAAARHLANAGVDVCVTTTRPGADLTGVPAHQFRILERMGVVATIEPEPADLVIDALIGYSLNGAPSGRSDELIHTVNSFDAVLALDTPSGLDVTSGATPGSVVRADVTMTLALPKVGLRQSDRVGRLLIADISVPRSITDPLGGSPDFRRSPIIELVAFRD